MPSGSKISSSLCRAREGSSLLGKSLPKSSPSNLTRGSFLTPKRSSSSYLSVSELRIQFVYSWVREHKEVETDILLTEENITRLLVAPDQSHIVGHDFLG